MKLPNVQAAVVSKEKIVGYLLNQQHPDGRGKAIFFGNLGFDIEKWSALADALRKIAVENDVALEVESPHGRKYIIDGTLESPSSQMPRVRTVWIIDHGESNPRLVTAYPGNDGDIMLPRAIRDA